MAAGCTLSKTGLKSWRAVGYCGLFGRTRVPCNLLASADQSVLVGDGWTVGEGRLVGAGVEAALLEPGASPWQAESTPGSAPTAHSEMNSRRSIFSDGTTSEELSARFIG